MYRQSEKNLLNSNISSRCPHTMVNFGPLAAEICWRVWGTRANFNGFRILAALLNGTLVVGVSQTLRRWTEGATYIRQGGHHVGHWTTFLVKVTSTLMWLLCVPLYRSGWKLRVLNNYSPFWPQFTETSFHIVICTVTICCHVTFVCFVIYAVLFCWTLILFMGKH